MAENNTTGEAAGIHQSQATEIPAREQVKFYQVGSYAIGNRLVGLKWRSWQSSPYRKNSLIPGHRACQGCGEALGVRHAVDTAPMVVSNRTIATNATGRLGVFPILYPETAWMIPWLHSLFGNTATVASGAAAGSRAMGKSGIRAIARGGDDGTVDIGMGCLSGMLERNDDVLCICYDNQAYMNTGVQCSGATSPTARTATTQPVEPRPGNVLTQGKNMVHIVMAHEIPYVATATIADLRDLEYRVEKAISFRGARYIHVLVSCSLGWGSNSNLTVTLARLTIQTGLFPTFEIEGGEIISVTKIHHPVSVEEYLCPQRRLAHILKGPGSEVLIARLQAIADRNISRYGLVETDALDEDVQR